MLAANIKNPGSGATRAGGNVVIMVCWTNAQFTEPLIKSQPPSQ
jgi:hypothetical protein